MDVDRTLPEIDETELMIFAPTLVTWRMGLLTTEDDVAQFMYRGGPVSPEMSAAPLPKDDNRPDKSYWENVKKEMRLLLCTNDAKYRELWKRINALEKKTTTALRLVGLVATFLGASIGAPAAILAGFVAVCLYAFAKVGKEAYGSYTSHVGA